MTQEIIEKPMSAECTMKQYEAIPDADFVENREYQLTDYPDNGANAEQMAYALTCKRLFPADTVVTFSGTTDTNYTNGHLYQIEVDTNGTKSWKDITPAGAVVVDVTLGTAITDDEWDKLLNAEIAYVRVAEPSGHKNLYIKTWEQESSGEINLLVFGGTYAFAVGDGSAYRRLSSIDIFKSNKIPVSDYTYIPKMKAAHTVSPYGLVVYKSYKGSFENEFSTKIPTKQQTYFVTELPTKTDTPYAEHDLVVVNNQTVYALEKVNNVLTWVKKYITAPFDYVKFETLTNGDGSKEDKIIITDPDASFNIVYEGENSTANIAISKGFTEMAVLDSLGSSRVSLSGNSVNLITQGTEETNKMEMVIASNDATLNNKSIEQRYLDLTGDSGTLDADQYKLVTTYDDLIIRIAGISYRQVGKPQNGTGNYIFTNTYYAQPNGTEEFVAYIITIKTDKTWTSTIKNFLQIGQQTYAPFVEITPSTATNGNLSDDDYTNLTEHDDVYIILNNEYYRKADNQHTTGIISYTHTGWNGTQTQDKSINITVATKAWSLVVGTPDTTPTKDSTNTVTSGGVYTALDKLAQSYEQTEADNAVIIRNGNIVKQMATFTVTGNTEKIWSFPYSYDTGKKPIVWVNSVAEGNSANNGAAVTSWSEASMTVRSCGVDSEITFYAEGWITK